MHIAVVLSASPALTLVVELYRSCDGFRTLDALHTSTVPLLMLDDLALLVFFVAEPANYPLLPLRSMLLPTVDWHLGLEQGMSSLYHFAVNC